MRRHKSIPSAYRHAKNEGAKGERARENGDAVFLLPQRGAYLRANPRVAQPQPGHRLVDFVAVVVVPGALPEEDQLPLVVANRVDGAAVVPHAVERIDGMVAHSEREKRAAEERDRRRASDLLLLRKPAMGERMAVSLTASQLRRLPSDVLLHLIPYLAEPASDTPTLTDRWALNFAQWAAPVWRTPIASLPRYSARFDTRFGPQQVRDNALLAYLVFGADDVPPWSVYCGLLQECSEDADVLVGYATVLRYRMILAGTVEADDLQAEREDEGEDEREEEEPATPYGE
jgi:hypothetical protein